MFKKLFVSLLVLMNTMTFGYSEQVIVSQFDFGLKNSNNYILSDLSTNGVIRAISNKTDSLEDSIDFDFTYGNNFTAGAQTGTFGYNGQEEKSLIIPVNRNSSATVKSGSFELREVLRNTQTGEDVTTVLLQENYVLPARVINMREASSSSGKEFVYSEPSDIKIKHLEEFKIQDFMIRVSKQDVNSDYDILTKTNRVRQAGNVERGYSEDNAEMFYKGLSTYVDFWVTGDKYDKEQKIETNSGMGLRFLPGKINLYGLPKGNYRIELYSFRYSKDITNKGNVVITKESAVNFQSDNYTPEEGINLLSFYTGNYPNIEATVLTIGKTSDATLNIFEFSNGYTKVPSNINKTRVPVDKVYFDNINPINLDSNGYDPNTKLYYQKWKIDYRTQFTDMDNNIRKANFLMTSVNKAVSADYGVKVDFPLATGYPHQTVMAIFNPPKNWSAGDYDIVDRTMNKYTRGYKEIKVTQAESMAKLYLGEFIDRFTMVLDTISYYWKNYNSSSNNSVIIKKVPSESKSTLTKLNGEEILTYYTTVGVKNFNYVEEGSAEKADRATFSWETPLKTSFGVTLNEDKIIFRVVRLNNGEAETTPEYYSIGGHNYTENLPKRYYKQYEKTNIIGSGDVNKSINDFVDGRKDYFDLVFDSGLDKEITAANAVFTYSKDNSLQVVGLPRGNYLIQIYSLQDEDSYAKANGSYSYRVLTYSGYKRFEMGLPTLVTGDFLGQNNIFIIDNINLTKSFDDKTNMPVKNVQVGFYTKAQTTLPLMTTDNLVARRDEATDKKERPFAVTEQRNYTGDILPVEELKIGKSTKEDFQFPLDIMLVIDNSTSMQPEITAVKNGLISFTNDLNARGFNVKYNLVTFGGPQISSTIGNNQVYTYEDYQTANSSPGNPRYPFFAQFKGAGNWFSSAEEVTTALGKIRTMGGYPNGQENGAWALKRSMDYLKTYGRYLDKDNKIVTASGEGYIPSQKWVIFLTDENLNMNGQRALYGTSNDVQFKTRFLDDIKSTADQHKIVFTGIFHINGTRPATREVDDIGNAGVNPSDTGQMNYNDIKNALGSNLFKTYEMGSMGQNVTTALAHAVTNVGVVQRWEMSYSSPFKESDGLKREVIFSLKNLPRVNQYDATRRAIVEKELTIKPIIRGEERYYVVPQEKLEANFINPDPILKKIVKRDGKITLKAMARSEFRAPNGMMYNYPIKKGTFVISDGKTDPMTVSSDDITGEKVYLKDIVNGYGQKWYEATSTIDTEGFEKKFGKHPILNVQFIAETEEQSKKIFISGVEYSEGDAPKIISLDYSNETLKEFMSSLAFEKNSKLFNDSEIDLATKAKIISLDTSGVKTTDFGNISKLINVKPGDKIDVEFEVDDESIGRNSENVKLRYGNEEFKAVYLSNIGGLESTKTKWKVELTYKSGIKNLIFNIQDDTSLKNVTSLGGQIFVEPKLLENTTYAKNKEENADSSGVYYNKPLTTVVNKNDEILAYITAFTYDMSYADEGAKTSVYPTEGVSSWVSSKTGEFPFGDGKYDYDGTVYIINKAGAISGITNSSTNKLSAIINRIWSTSFQSNYYVDRVAPKSSQFTFRKVADVNFMGNTYRDNEANKILTGENKAYKVGDTISISATIKEKNFQKIAFDDGESKNIFNDSKWGEPINSVYVKTGTAKDYNEAGISGVFSSSLGLKIYDKAGNMSQQVQNNGEKLKVSIVYDDRVPGDLGVKEKQTWSNYKFTNDTSLPLENGTPEIPIVFVESHNGYIGAFSSVSLLKNERNSYPIINNALNIFNLRGFSQSGMPSYRFNEEEIILDTEINDKRTSFIKTLNSGGQNAQTSLSEIFSTVGELVGIESFKIGTPQGITNIKILQNGVELVKNSEEKYFVTDAAYRSTIGSSNFTNNYVLNFSTSVRGNISFPLTIIDRLGNQKTFNYTVIVPNNVTIIGKTIGSPREIETKVTAGSRPLIESRLEK